MEALSLVRDCFVVGFGCLMKIGLRMVRYQSVILSFNYWSGVVDERLTQSRVVNARTRTIVHDLTGRMQQGRHRVCAGEALKGQSAIIVEDRFWRDRTHRTEGC